MNCECGNKRAKNRTICYKCIHKREKERDPERYTYGVLRRNARRRGKEFTITLEDFREFCVKTEYMNGKGRTKYSLHVDREDETKGYTKDNIRALPNIDNVQKYIAWRRQRDGSSSFVTRTITVTKEEDIEDLPF